MKYVRVVTVGLKEIKRTTSVQESYETLVAEAKKLAETAGGHVISTSWIEGYLIQNDADVPKALQPDYDLNQHRWVGVDHFQEVIAYSHEKGWMEKGEWIAKAA